MNIQKNKILLATKQEDILIYKTRKQSNYKFTSKTTKQEDIPKTKYAIAHAISATKQEDIPKAGISNSATKQEIVSKY